MADEAQALHIDPNEVKELPLVDLAYKILQETNKPFYYRDLMAEVARLRGMSEDEVNEVIARLYTEINVDGRFVHIGNNVWGLKRWYPVDKAMDKSGGKQFIRREVDWDEDDDDVDLYEEEELEADEEGFGDEDEEDLEPDADDQDDLVSDDDFQDDILEDEDLDHLDEDEEDF